MRYWLEADHFGKPEDYPTYSNIADHIAKFLDMTRGRFIPVYICWAYQSKKTGLWGPTPEDKWNDPFWSHDWRKPAPGMIFQAMKDTKCKPYEVLMVGNSNEDAEAAIAADVSFISADEFFRR